MKGLANVQVTLYDIFGYLLVGFVAASALVVFGWALVLPGAALGAPRLTSAEWFAAVFSAYIVGHLIQAVANSIFDHSTLKPRAVDAWSWVPESLRTGILEKTHGAKREHEDHEAHAVRVFELCDIVLAQRGSTGDREIYQYREGFYRGLTVSFALGIVAVVVRAVCGGGAHVGRHSLTTGDYLLASLVLLVAALLSYHRYQRFFELKLHNAYVAFAELVGLIEVPKS